VHNAVFGDGDGVTIGGLSRTSNDGVFFGTDTGNMHFIDYTSFSTNVVATGLGPLSGTPYASPGGDDLIIQSDSGQMLWWKLGMNDVYPLAPTVTRPLDGGGEGFANFGLLYPAQSSGSEQIVLFNTGLVSAISDNPDTRGNVVWTGDTDQILYQAPILEDGATSKFVYQVGAFPGKIYKWSLPEGTLVDGYPYECDGCSSDVFQSSGIISSDSQTIFYITETGLLIAADVNVPAPPTESPVSAPTPMPVTAAPVDQSTPTKAPSTTTPAPTPAPVPEPTDSPVDDSAAGTSSWFVATASCAVALMAANVADLVY
jgi:hypothetical protein